MKETAVGRFAPSPSGRLHLGNLFAALLAWLDVRSAGGRLVLRIEDLDRERCSREKAAQLCADLRWLGLDWDEGGLAPEYCQSCREEYYQAAFDKLAGLGLVYPCFCSRAERLAYNVAAAPHLGEERRERHCPCRDMPKEKRRRLIAEGRRPAWRVRVPDLEVAIMDGNLGLYRENLAADCGDFIIRRSDGLFAYQLAVVADDGAMGVSRVVRGRDLLSSAPRQRWLHTVLGQRSPEFWHVPLLLAADGKRLAKRDAALAMDSLRERWRPEQLVGGLAWLAGLLAEPVSCRPEELINGFSWDKVAKADIKLPV